MLGAGMPSQAQCGLSITPALVSKGTGRVVGAGAQSQADLAPNSGPQ